MDEQVVLFVCTGNTCRSPLAEGLMRKECPDLKVESAGVAAFDGGMMSADSADLLEAYGIKTSDFRSRMVTEEMVERATVIIGMTNDHIESLKAHFPEHQRRIHLAGSFAGEGYNEVPDPIGRGPQAYADVEEMLTQAVRGICAYLKELREV